PLPCGTPTGPISRSRPASAERALPHWSSLHPGRQLLLDTISQAGRVEAVVGRQFLVGTGMDVVRLPAAGGVDRVEVARIDDVPGSEQHLPNLAPDVSIVLFCDEHRPARIVRVQYRALVDGGHIQHVDIDSASGKLVRCGDRLEDAAPARDDRGARSIAPSYHVGFA